MVKISNTTAILIASVVIFTGIVTSQYMKQSSIEKQAQEKARIERDIRIAEEERYIQEQSEKRAKEEALVKCLNKAEERMKTSVKDNAFESYEDGTHLVETSFLNNLKKQKLEEQEFCRKLYN